MRLESEAPTTEQLGVLYAVAARVLLEFRLEKEGIALPKTHSNRASLESPLLGFCHETPGTGKRQVIQWIRRMFMEALGWVHCDEFLSVAFQSRVADSMDETTIHSGGDIGVDASRALCLGHTGIDIFFTRNQYLRWIIIDELSMVFLHTWWNRDL